MADTYALMARRDRLVRQVRDNLDFLIGQQFCERVGATLLRDPSVHTLNGRPTLLMHGDSLCTADDQHAFAWFYPPVNPRAVAPEGTRPQLLVTVHGGPTAAARTAFSPAVQYWTSRGFAVADVDYRGSTGYGRRFLEEFLADFAGDDIEDIASAVSYIETLPYVDGERLGIWGSSYGGTLTVYTLLKKPGLFRAGVAGAAAVDPYFFGTDDVAIVRRPDSHPEIFENAAVRYAANLDDHLLLIHGMQDQVVPFKTTVVLAEALIREGKNFDVAFAPGATHSWSRETPYARFLFGKLLEHFDRYLGPSTLNQPETAGGKAD